MSNFEKKSIYDIIITTYDNKKYSLKKYKGNVLLIVNIASNCGFAKRALESLSNLLTIYYSKGLRIILFPCKQFFNQEHSDINKVNKIVNEYNSKFELMMMTDVVGKTIHPLFKYLCDNTKGFITSHIKWNFTSFLIDRNGNIIKRYSPTNVINLDDHDLIRCIGKEKSIIDTTEKSRNISPDIDDESDF